MKQYKNIIFDVGQVLFDYRCKDMLVLDYGLGEEEAQRVNNEMFNDELWHELDLWNMHEEEIIDAYEKKYPKDAEAIRWFISHGERMQVARPKVWEGVHGLKEQGYGIYLLSNYPENLFVKHTREASFMKDVDGAVVSYQIHIAKPDARIYETLIRQYGLEKNSCLFFDDRQENIDGAIACGIDAKRVYSQESLLQDLSAILTGKFVL